MKNKQGFTLVELIISFGLTTVLITVLSQVFISILNLRQKSEATSSLAQDSRYILSRLAYDIDSSSAITVPGNNSTSSDLTLTISGQTYHYELSGTVLTLSVAGGTPVALSSPGSQLTSLTFTRDNSATSNRSLHLDFTLAASEVPSRRIQTTFTTD